MSYNTVTCICGGGGGFTNLHPAPREGDPGWWVCVYCKRPSDGWLRSQGEDVLNYFRGGPLDGRAYETSTILRSPHDIGSFPITQYQWSPEVLVSEKTGAKARVWLHKEELASGAISAPPTQNAGPQSSTPEKKEVPAMAEATENTEETVTNDLLERRTALKLSRAVVAEKAGLTQAKVYRIEKGGSRTTAEEIKQVADALDELTPADDPS